MASSPSPQGAASSATPPPPPPPPPAPSAVKKGFLRRVLPLLLTANLAVGAYIFARAYQKDTEKKEDEAAVAIPSSLASTTAVTATEKTSGVPAPQPVTVHPPISEEEQVELFKWILEEKRKVKPREKSERKKIDEEKALLKEFVRAKSVPSL